MPLLILTGMTDFLRRAMHVRDLMTRDVCKVAIDASVETAAHLMAERGISAIPVLDRHGALIGIVSEGDLLHRKEIGTQKRHGRKRWLLDPDTLARDYARSRSQRVADVMVAPVVTIAPATTMGEAADLMDRYGVKRLPVVDHGRLVGILSRADLVRSLAATKPRATKQVEDSELRSAMLRHMRAQDWTAGATIEVAVNQGVMTLTGIAVTEDQRQALRVMAESFPGVRRVDCAVSLRPYGDNRLGPDLSSLPPSIS